MPDNEPTSQDAMQDKSVSISTSAEVVRHQDIRDEPQSVEPAGKLFPVMLFAVGCYAFDLLWPQFAMSVPSPVPAGILTGCLLGQACFSITLAGLLSRNWLVGYYWGLGMWGLGYLMIFLGTVAATSGRTSPMMWSGLAFIPLGTALGVIPFWACRWLRGWCLLQAEPGQRYRCSAVGMSEILLATTVIASSLILSRYSFYRFGANLEASQDRWLFTLLSQLATVAILAPFVLLSVWISFSTLAERRFALQVGLGVCTLTLLLVLMGIMGAGADGEFFAFALVIVTVAYGVLFVGLGTLQAAGFRLISHADRVEFPAVSDRPTRTPSPFDEVPTESATGEEVVAQEQSGGGDGLVWLYPSPVVEWWLAGLLVVLAMLATLQVS